LEPAHRPPAAFQERDPGLGLIAGTAQLVELALQGADLRRVEEGREAERRGLAQLPNPSFSFAMVLSVRSSS
jgi:hypothetical protein